MPTPLLMQKLRLGGRNLRKFVNRGPGLSLIVSSLDRHLSALEFVALPSRIRKPPGMPYNRMTQLQQDGIRLAKRLPRLTQCFVLAFQALQEDMGMVAK